MLFIVGQGKADKRQPTADKRAIIAQIKKCTNKNFNGILPGYVDGGY